MLWMGPLPGTPGRGTFGALGLVVYLKSVLCCSKTSSLATLYLAEAGNVYVVHVHVNITMSVCVYSYCLCMYIISVQYIEP